MRSTDTSCASRDILSRPLLTFLLYVLPTIAIVLTASPHFSAALRTAVWTFALAVMGIACVANAARCGRTHCYLTGPFFLLMALVTLLYGLGVLTLGRNGWNLIGLAILVGAIALCCLPDLLLGKYRAGRSADPGNS